MSKDFEVCWEGRLPAAPEVVWDAITVHCGGWLWPIAYEPGVGGTEAGLTAAGGTVTTWEPSRHFATRATDGTGFNELDYRLEPSGTGTYLLYRHRGVMGGDYALELDACRRHTAFYYHSLGQYVRHFAGREAVYGTAEAPEISAHGGFATLRRALGVADDVAVGDRVRLTPVGPAPIEGVVDYADETFLGVRGADALYRFYGRDAWKWPVGVALHLFADGGDAAVGETWQTWLDGVFATEAVA
ncbi:hypothetical protein [Actinoallomurus sp. CA-150999]|uniref:hypothetical protein n=1 Tax=Actinoallomurus sp. CA-150999 TaxID=3239887 RepID=UPI003D8BE3E9